MRSFRILIIVLGLLLSASACSTKNEAPPPDNNTETNRNSAVTNEQKLAIAKFVRAADRGDVQTVLDSLDAGVDINGKNQEGLTALMVASREGHLKIVQLLLRRGADMSIVAKSHDAISWAALDDRPQVMKCLIENGEDVKTVNERNGYILWLAAHNKTPDALNILLTNGLKVDQYDQNDNETTPMHPAAARCRIENMKILLKEGSPLDHHDKFDGNTPLIAAAWKNCTEGIKLLVEKGADVNQKNKYGDTALCYAARRANFEAAKYLIEHGADPDHKNKEGRTALDFAIDKLALHQSEKAEYNKVIQFLEKHMNQQK